MVKIKFAFNRHSKRNIYAIVKRLNGNTSVYIVQFKGLQYLCNLNNKTFYPKEDIV